MIPAAGLVYIERKTLIEEFESAGKHSKSGFGYHIRFFLTSPNLPIFRGIRETPPIGNGPPRDSAMALISLVPIKKW
jgi:hypothetical protein